MRSSSPVAAARALLRQLLFALSGGHEDADVIVAFDGKIASQMRDAALQTQGSLLMLRVLRPEAGEFEAQLWLVASMLEIL